ncbi:hypothetical protein [Erwinia rhapontici]|nr:hypothetical protein [Erwinia rhapontici]MBP2156085.1 hypothetical protein [Erwinia rhapontici]
MPAFPALDAEHVDLFFSGKNAGSDAVCGGSPSFNAVNQAKI